MVVGWTCEPRTCGPSLACPVEAICCVLYILADVSTFKVAVNGGRGARTWRWCGCIQRKRNKL